MARVYLYSYLYFFLFCLIACAFLFTSVIYDNHLSTLAVKGALDIRTFYTSGKMLKSHVTSDFYSLNTQYYWQKMSFPLLNNKDQLMPFMNPSLAALPFYLFSGFPVITAYRLFAFCNLILAILSFFILLRGLNAFTSKFLVVLLCCMFFTYYPFWEAILQGQLSFILLLSAVSSWYMFKKQKYVAGGFLLSLLIIKPHLMILPFILLIFKKQWKILLGLITGVLLAILAFIFATGPMSIFNYVKLLTFVSSVDNNTYTIHPQLYSTIQGFLQTMYHTNNLKPILPFYIIFYLVFTGILMYIWRGKINNRSEKFNLQWSVLILTLILTSMHLYPHDLVLVIFPLAAILSVSRKYYFSSGYSLSASLKNLFTGYLLLTVIFISGLFLFHPLVIVPFLVILMSVCVYFLNGNQGIAYT